MYLQDGNATQGITGIASGARRDDETVLAVGDHLLLYSDGMTEAHNGVGELFGVQRLGDYLVKALADALPAAETMRRLVQALLQYQHDQLRDDESPDWQPISSLPPAEPRRGDYRNASKYCKALRDFLGDAQFKKRYKNHGKCVSANH